MNQNSFDLAKALIKSIALRYEAKFEPASVEQWAQELKEYSKDDLNKAFQRFKVEYESLPYRFSVSAGLIKQLKPTLTTATVEERLYSSLQDKNPYTFLKNISPKLMELADQGGLFDRSISITDQGFRVRDIAKRFLEWEQNKQKGFLQKEPVPGQKRIEFERKDTLGTPNPLKGLPFPKSKEEAEKFFKEKNHAPRSTMA
jgi:hypothetical protein